MSRVRGFTRVELLVILVIAAVAAACWVLAVSRARENARRSQCKGHLGQMGLALSNYGELHRTLPPGWIGVRDGRPDVNGTNRIGWAALVLPQFELAADAPRFQPDLDLGAFENDSFREQRLPFYVCPSAGPSIIWQGKFTPVATGNYVGCMGSISCEVNTEGQCVSKGTFFHNSHLRWGDEIDKSTLFLAGERSPAFPDGPFAVWSGAIPTWEACLSVVSGAPQSPPIGSDGFSSFHLQGANVLYADGRVRFLSTQTDAVVMRTAADIPVGIDF